jgi:RNA polymerase sigma factor (sigma-70 family)
MQGERSSRSARPAGEAEALEKLKPHSDEGPLAEESAFLPAGAAPLAVVELQRTAILHLRSKRAAAPLKPAALIHEAFVALRDKRILNLESEPRFRAGVAHLMRHVLVDCDPGESQADYHDNDNAGSARDEQPPTEAREPTQEQGPAPAQKPEQPGKLLLADEADLTGRESIGLMELHESLQRLSALDPKTARVVDLRLFGGLHCREIATLTGIPENTVERQLTWAIAWVRKELGDLPNGR